MNRDYYDILGVSRTATVELIRAAHRVQSRRYHPDTADDGKGDARLFAEIQEAYETLSNPDNRRRYDTKEGFTRGEFSAGGIRRPPKTACGVCKTPVYASQLQLYLGRYVCIRCFEKKRQRENNRPRLTGLSELTWRLKLLRVWVQSHFILIAVILVALGAVGARLATVGGHAYRPERPAEASPATSTSNSAPAPAPADPILNPCRVTPMASSESADVRSASDKH